MCLIGSCYHCVEKIQRGPAWFKGTKLVVGGLDPCGQATKGTWGMSWRQKALKGVENCDKPGVAVKRALIPRFPN